MLRKPEIHPNNLNVRLAEDVTRKKEGILGRWLERVRCSPAIIHAEPLNTVASKRHVPQIREDLIDFLLRHGSGAVAGQALNAIEDLWSQSTLRGRFSQGNDKC